MRCLFMPPVGKLLFIFLIGFSPVFADGPVAYRLGEDGKPVVVKASESKSSEEGDKDDKSKEKSDDDKDGDDKKEEDKEPPEPKIIRRGEVVDGQADAEELKSAVGDDGKVAFQFRNQSWVELVDWLSVIANKPLDWLELPGDRVNLASPGRYTVAETQDLFNRHLLARGFTILEMDGGMTITQTKNINPAIVPRVNVDELSTLQPHDYVRTSLDVGWLSSDKLAAELAALISTNGRLTAMTTTNRIEAMDSVINLRDVASVLEEERSAASLEALAPEFSLRYLPAQDAKAMLEDFLGIKKEKSAPMTPQQMQMLQQQMRNNRGGVTGSKKPDISIVANVRQNSIIIRAPVDRIAIAMEFLKRIDVPNDVMSSLADIQTRIQVFRLSSLDPKKLIEIVGEMNVLEPGTRIRADNDNNALIVSGSAADRFIIKSLIERLDGSGRSFQVLQLRRLDAADVAESISFLMGQKKDDDEDNSRSRYRYYGYYGNDDDEKKETDEFRVAANARYRQVLLWANDSEMEQVESLLIKLGELPPPGGSKRTIRTIDASATPETYEYLRRLQKQWQATSPNPMELPDANLFKDPLESESDDEKEMSDDKDDAAESKDKDESKSTKEEKADDSAKPKAKMGSDDEGDLVKNDSNRGYQLTVMQPPAVTGQAEETQQAAALNADSPIRSSKDFDRFFSDKPAPPVAQTKTNQPPSPVRISVDSQGNLVLMSNDTKALDQLENLMLQAKPPRRPYTVFKIKHASSFWVKLNLEDYFKDEDSDDDSSADSFYRWYWDQPEEKDDGPSGLGKGNKMRFVEDMDTNTIVVSGATNEQLRTIKELIGLWDVQEPANKRKMRFTQLVSVKYGSSEKIAETLKEAYRDLLSSNDKSFNNGGQKGGGQERQNTAQRSREGNGSSLSDRNKGKEGGGSNFSFKGKLSFGIDGVGNTLLVSAEGEDLLELVVGKIEELDLAARSAGEVQVVEVPSDISSESIQRALKAFGANPTQNIAEKVRGDKKKSRDK